MVISQQGGYLYQHVPEFPYDHLTWVEKLLWYKFFEYRDKKMTEDINKAKRKR